MLTRNMDDLRVCVIPIYSQKCVLHGYKNTLLSICSPFFNEMLAYICVFVHTGLMSAVCAYVIMFLIFDFTYIYLTHVLK